MLLAVKVNCLKRLNILISLTSLGKFINALAENSPHIPIQDSKLTRLLRDSFGGYPNLFVFGSLSLYFNLSNRIKVKL